MAEKTAVRIQLEIQQLDQLLEVYGQLLDRVREETPNLVEVTALASVLHSFYTGAEKIFLYVADGIDKSAPSGEQWHRDLLAQMAAPRAARGALVSGDLIVHLKEYLAFRHFYRHGYSLVLEWEKLEGLIQPLFDVWAQLKRELETFLDNLEEDGQESVIEEQEQ